MSGQPPEKGPARAGVRKPGRLAFGLLIYLAATVVVFDLVWKYTPRLAERIGHIEYGWLRFGIYFVVYALLTLGATFALRRFPFGLRGEGLLRLSFGAAVTLSFAVALYQNRFGTGLSATYFTVGLLGAFAGVLVATQRYFGLLEVNAPPPPDVVAAVVRAHEHVVIADGWSDHVERAIELTLSLVLIVLSLPISIPLAIVIWLQDPGPLLFAKVVVTRGGYSFRQLKLRSMVKNAEASTGAIPAALDDGRITILGQVLRRTHIDELPQMINIARGEMSLVGPRPERTIFVHRHLRTLPNYALRHAVRPGLAGMAQVYGDYYSVPREKLRYDLLYIKRRSFLLDLKLFLTATLAGLVGYWPGMNRGRRRFTARRQQERWRNAYEALHGGDPTEPPPSTEPDRRVEADKAPVRKRLSEPRRGVLRTEE